MANLQAPDAKKEEFRSYLGRSGVIDALTKGERRARTCRRRQRAIPRAAFRLLSACSLWLRYFSDPAVLRRVLPPVLVSLYEEPEKPANAIEFIKMTLGAPTGTDVEALKAESEGLRAKVEELEAKLADAQKKLEEGAAAE